MNFRSISVVCGPGEVRYGITNDGQLFVWIGNMVDVAPPGAQEASIGDGFTTWTISDAPPESTDGTVDHESLEVTSFGAEQ